MQLPKGIMQMRPHSPKNSPIQSWQPATALACRLKNGWGFNVVKQSNCYQGLAPRGGFLVLKLFIFSNMHLRSINYGIR